MAEFDPDAFIKKGESFDPDKFISGKKDSNDSAALGPPLDPIEQGVRGLATGVETAVDTAAGYIPGSRAHRDPKLVQETLAKRPPPSSGIEKAGVFGGEMLPSFMIPYTGLGKVAARAVGLGMPRVATMVGAATEGGVQGGLGGLTIPGDRSRNADIGTGTGAALRGGGAAAQIAIDAIPPRLKNTLAALAAVAAASKMGMPPWYAFIPHGWSSQQGQYIGSFFRQLYDANLARLADLAGKGVRQGTREINPAAAGAFTAETMKQGSGQ